MLGNPRIDKRTLLKKFIAKIEMESNVQKGGHLASELSQIKQMMNDANEWMVQEEEVPLHDPRRNHQHPNQHQQEQ